MFSFFSGCVVPLSPDFQDPSPVPNYSPHLVNSDPFAETTGLRPPQTFKVEVADPNSGDLLYVRWVSDYPPFTQADSKLLVTPPVVMGMMVGAHQGTIITYELGSPNLSTCRELPAGDHKLVVIVWDRPFLPSDQFNIDPAHRYNATVSGTAPIMAGWSVTCP